MILRMLWWLIVSRYTQFTLDARRADAARRKLGERF